MAHQGSYLRCEKKRDETKNCIGLRSSGRPCVEHHSGAKVFAPAMKPKDKTVKSFKLAKLSKFVQVPGIGGFLLSV